MAIGCAEAQRAQHRVTNRITARSVGPVVAAVILRACVVAIDCTLRI